MTPELIIETTQTLLLLFLTVSIINRSNMVQKLLEKAVHILKEPKVDKPVPLNVSIRPGAPAPTHKNLCQILKKEGDQMVPFGWVRTGSSAWHKAYGQPGFYLKAHDGTIEEGVQ